LRIVSVGTKPPSWVISGFAEYSRRMPPEMSVDLVEVDAPKHHMDKERVMGEEGARSLQKVGDNDWVIAMDEHAPMLSSANLAAKMADWRMRGTDVTFMIGGADGLAKKVRARANEAISLSKLTFPHYVVRVILAESLYRAWTIHSGHPYHRT